MNIFELFSNIKKDPFPINTEKDILESSELMGIGLAFCHKVLIKMGSELKLTSTLNVGSTFNFSLCCEFPNKDLSVNEIIPYNTSIQDAISMNESLHVVANQNMLKFQSYE